ncbi:MAG: hypothetical protein ACI4MJ_01185 [Aristaeellaceae bacterium]
MDNFIIFLFFTVGILLCIWVSIPLDKRKQIISILFPSDDGQFTPLEVKQKELKHSVISLAKKCASTIEPHMDEFLADAPQSVAEKLPQRVDFDSAIQACEDHIDSSMLTPPPEGSSPHAYQLYTAYVLWHFSRTFAQYESNPEIQLAHVFIFSQLNMQYHFEERFGSSVHLDPLS